MIAQSKTVFAKSSSYAVFFHDTFDDQVQNVANSVAIIQEHDLFWCGEGRSNSFNNTAFPLPVFLLCLVSRCWLSNHVSQDLIWENDLDAVFMSMTCTTFSGIIRSISTGWIPLAPVIFILHFVACCQPYPQAFIPGEACSVAVGHAVAVWGLRALLRVKAVPL